MSTFPLLPSADNVPTALNKHNIYSWPLVRPRPNTVSARFSETKMAPISMKLLGIAGVLASGNSAAGAQTTGKS